MARTAKPVSPVVRVEGLIQQGINQVEDAIYHMMTTYKNDNSIAMNFNILWSIWKARYDLLFNRKHKAPFQVLHAAQALLNTGEVGLQEHGG
jgi:hypothetical protein